jgi:arylamine N-acetyltransferase
MKEAHDAPLFRCDDKLLLKRFFTRYGIDPHLDNDRLMVSIANVFSRIPYENLTKIIKSDGLLNPESAIRYPREVLEDHLKWGTGGTCFSLTAAIIAVYGALGFMAYPLLADRHYGTDTHCGLVVLHQKNELLVDPGYLLFVPTPLPVTTMVRVHLGYSTIELNPVDGGKRIELITEVRGSRKLRLTYKRAIVDPETFVRAWKASFAWEMMTYPVLTRCSAGEHHYLQGARHALRNADGTVRSTLSAAEQIEYIGGTMGVSREVVLKAWKVIGYGKD